MKRILMPALTLAAMTTAAAAEPQAMSEDQLAGIAGGATGVVQNIAQWQQAHGLALDLSPFGGAADVGIHQRQDVANDAMAPVLIVPGMSDAAPALPGGEVGFGTNFNSSQSFN